MWKTYLLPYIVVDGLWISEGLPVDKGGIKFKKALPLPVPVDKFSTMPGDNLLPLSTALITCGKLVHIFCGKMIYHGAICGKCGKLVHIFCGQPIYRTDTCG